MITSKKKLFTTTVVWFLVMALVSAPLAGGKKLFSHKKHQEEGSDCVNCHQADPGREFPILLDAACADCHEEAVPAGRLPAKARKMQIRFPHKLHTESQECAACHQSTRDETQNSGEPVMGYARCAACHGENGIQLAEGKCLVCHGADQRKVAPTDHRQAWLARHGRESHWRVFDRHGEDCSLCHRSDACLTCHKSNKPQSHTVLWRTHTHGILASWDRESCQTCHTAGACVRCHRTTAPLNHKGAWKSTHGLAAQTRSNQYCAVCHRLSWCAACHLEK